MKKGLLIGILILLIVAPAAAQDQPQAALPWWNDRVFYEIFVRSFYDSDGDGIGDLQGVIEKLDYLNDGDPNTTTDLGVTGIWLMPITQSPSYHGYDVIDYREVEADYGTNDDFRALMSAAHERGIAVIVDFVANHSSDQHPWFRASAQGDPEYDDWYLWSDSDPNYNGPWNQEVWHRRGDRFYYGVFWGGMPDLNHTNPEVTQAMYENARFWLQDMGADGFRVDGLKHVIEDGRQQENTPATIQWAADFNAYLNSIAPDSLMVGEVWTSSYFMAQYMEAGSADLVFEFDLASAMVDSAGAGSRSAVASLAARADELFPNGQYAAFLTNHDQNRVMSELRGRVEQAKMAASLLLTGRGVPFLYYGEEIGMVGMKPDERIRTPMQWDSTERTGGFTSGRPWQAFQNDYETVNVAAQTDDPDSLLSHYRNLIHLRNAHVALRQGAYLPVDSSARGVYAFVRQHADETLLVILNLDNDPISDYTLTLDSGEITVETAEVVFGQGEVTPLGESGAFADYTPIAELLAYSTTVIRLAGGG